MNYKKKRHLVKQKKMSSNVSVQKQLAGAVFITLFFAGLASIYIAHATLENQIQSGTAALQDLMVLNTLTKSGNIAAATFFTAGAVLGLALVILLSLQLAKK